MRELVAMALCEYWSSAYNAQFRDTRGSLGWEGNGNEAKEAWRKLADLMLKAAKD